MKNLKILALIPALILCGCGKKDKWAGMYQFRLGKSDGNHMEIMVELKTDKDPIYSDYKIMSLSADLGDNMDPTSALDNVEEIGEIIIPFLELFVEDIAEKFPTLMEVARKELSNFNDIKLYYNVTDVQSEDKNYRLYIGTHEIGDRLQTIKREYPTIADIVDEVYDYAANPGIPFLDKDLNLSPENSKYLFNAFIGKKGLKIQVPVSDDDLDMQLIWYGHNYPLFGEKLFDDDYMDKMPGEKGDKRLGTHPKKEVRNNVVIKDEVQEVNQIFQKEFSKTTLFTTDTPEGEELGKFAIENIDNDKHLKIIFTGDKLESFDGYVYKESEGWTHLAFENIPESGDLGIIVGSGNKAKISGKDGEEFRIKDFYTDPFVFRDFNIVDVGLSKVTE